MQLLHGVTHTHKVLDLEYSLPFKRMLDIRRTAVPG